MTYKEYFDSISENMSEKEKEKLTILGDFLIKLKNVEGGIVIPHFRGLLDNERFPNIHELKILPEYFEAVDENYKRFELRKDDRDYQVGDIVALEEWDGEKYTGKFTSRKIEYILRDCPQYGLADGFCILGF